MFKIFSKFSLWQSDLVNTVNWETYLAIIICENIWKKLAEVVLEHVVNKVTIVPDLRKSQLLIIFDSRFLGHVIGSGASYCARIAFQAFPHAA